MDLQEETAPPRLRPETSKLAKKKGKDKKNLPRNKTTTTTKETRKTVKTYEEWPKSTEDVYVHRVDTN